MTTVINFNFLNFFRLKPDNFTAADDSLSYDRGLYRGRQDYPRQQSGAGEVIDVTRYSRASAGNYEGTGLWPGERGRIIYFTDPARTENLYDRKGKTVQCADEKGARFSLYV